MIRFIPLLLLTSCIELGYVKVDFVGNKTDTQACSFADDFTKAKCVPMEDFLKEFDEKLKELDKSGSLSGNMEFEINWNDLTYCKKTAFGYVCSQDL